ncbi:UNVERIFIED_CONTAM: hypothetical protein Slati_4187600 [Sesamum latifolium]|uniref:Uncharacterized protein n=1 Tax=Sesamum latifolium TaxID=2727402 RepID=A0AAW2TAR8_9LAMI
MNQQDSCDPGNHSDVTEERYEVKLPGPSFATGTLNSDNQEMKQEPADAHSSEPQTSKSSSSLADADKGSVQGGKCNSNISACESSAVECSFPMSNENRDQGFSGKQHEASANISSSHVGENTPVHASPRSSLSSELPIVLQETSKNVASVLDALQVAKLSLNQKLTSFAPVAGGASGNAIKPFNQETNNAHSFSVPVSSPGLFRLPTDYQYEANARANLGIGRRSTFANFLPEIAPARLLSEPFVESRSLFPGNPFLTAPHRPFTPEIRSGIPPQRSLSLSQHTLSQGPSSYRLDHFTRPVVPPVKDSYPFLPDITLRVPLIEEGTSRGFPSSESRLPSGTRLSSYDEYVRPNMYNR